ncbi:MAG: hypothetical protein P4L33_16560 [Capsulimonadaceae bacterium]|nr:hypothetical protein [Capsulimonadaceae bacterium]
MIYVICTYLLVIGLAGLVAQFLLGAGHVGHTGSHGHAAGHAHDAHSAQAGHEAAHTGEHSAPTASSSRAAGAFSMLMTLLSPLMIFSVSLGAGAGGLLLKPLHLALAEVAAAAAFSGIGLYAIVVRPIWRLLFRFASEPSEGLEGTIGHDATVIHSFDSSGRGLVKLTIDGQIANNVLAFLDESDKDHAADIHPGDILTVTSVDTHNNTCRVARL